MQDHILELREDFLNSVRSTDTERVEIVTDAYFKYIDMPPVLQRAHVTKEILRRMTIVIRENEIIVGNQGKEKRGVPLFPEYGYRWIMEQMDDFETRTGDKFRTTEEQKGVLRKNLVKWKRYSRDDRADAITPPGLQKILDLGITKNTNYKMSAPGHMSPDYVRLLGQGLSGVIEECRQKLGEVEKTELNYNYIEKSSFYQACIVTCEAIINFAERYADLADRMRREEKDPERIKELGNIAEICRTVPRNPARTYREALQFVYFVQLCMQIEANGLAICLGRLDQTLYPYYLIRPGKA
jgi:formate C-acetyltransferase